MSSKKREPHTAHTATRPGPAEKPAAVVPEVSVDERSQSIRVRAYGLWERAGKPDGDAVREQFWVDAENELRAASGQG